MLTVGSYTASSEFSINSFTTGHQLDSSVSCLRERCLVTWTSRRDSDGLQTIFARLFHAKGRPLSDEFPISNLASYHQGRSQSVALSDRFLVVMMHASRVGGETDIYGRFFDRNAKPLDAAFSVNTHTSGSQEFPIAVNLLGRFLVAYSGETGSGHHVFAQLFFNNGTRIGSELQLSAFPVAHESPRGIARVGSGFVISWWRSGQDANDLGVVASQFDGEARPLSSEFLVNSHQTSDQKAADVAAWPGGFCLVWQSYRQDGDSWGVYAKVYTERREIIASEFRVNEVISYDQTTARAVGLSAELIVTWQSTDQNTGRDVFGRRYSHRGMPMGSTFSINEHLPANQESASIAASSLGFFIAWQSNEQDGDRLGIFGRAFTQPVTTQTSTTLRPSSLPTTGISTSHSTTMLTSSTLVSRTSSSTVLLTNASTSGVIRLFASPSAPFNATPIWIAVIAALALSLCGMVWLYLHQRHQILQTDPDEEQDDIPRYQIHLPEPRQSTPADYDDFGIIEAENAKY